MWARSDTDLDLTAKEMAVAEWTYLHPGEPAGAGGRTLTDVKLFFTPMKSLEETIGVIGIRYDFKKLFARSTSPFGSYS